MKATRLLSVALVICSIFTMCKNEDDEDIIPDGGPSNEIIYLYSPDVLVKAHNAQILLPAITTAGSSEIEIISHGLYKIEKKDGTDEITLNGLFSDPPSEDELYGENYEPLYKQKIRVDFKHNNMATTRTATFRLHSEGQTIAGYADITFIQYGHN